MRARKLARRRGARHLRCIEWLRIEWLRLAGRRCPRRARPELLVSMANSVNPARRTGRSRVRSAPNAASNRATERPSVHRKIGCGVGAAARAPARPRGNHRSGERDAFRKSILESAVCGSEAGQCRRGNRGEFESARLAKSKASGDGRLHREGGFSDFPSAG
jgi:hypothetical protein